MCSGPVPIVAPHKIEPPQHRKVRTLEDFKRQKAKILDRTGKTSFEPRRTTRRVYLHENDIRFYIRTERYFYDTMKHITTSLLHWYLAGVLIFLPNVDTLFETFAVDGTATIGWEGGVWNSAGSSCL